MDIVDEHWWSRQSNNLSYVQYDFFGTQVLVGNRPDYGGCTKEFTSHVDAWFSVTDRVPQSPPGSRYEWYPWVEECLPTESLIAAVIRLHQLFLDDHIKCIYLHCDAGTHRSPSLFGLAAYFYDGCHDRIWERPQMRPILVRGMFNVATGHWSDPAYYAKTYLNDPKLPWVPGALKMAKEDPQAALRHVAEVTRGSKL